MYPGGEDGDEWDAPAGSPDDTNLYGFGGYQDTEISGLRRLGGGDIVLARQGAGARYGLNGSGGWAGGASGVVAVGGGAPYRAWHGIYDFGLTSAYDGQAGFSVANAGSEVNAGMPGFLRIIWGTGRAFPNTNVTDV